MAASSWFVRPVGAHGNTQNGQSYETAWCGWTAIQWGAGKVTTGDTLYVCGAHSYSSIILLGGVDGVTISGDYPLESGSLSFTGGSSYFNVNRSSTTVESLTISSDGRCIVPGGTPQNGFTLRNCTINGSSLPCIEFLSINTWGWINTTIDGNTFNGGAVGGTAGAAIWWFPQTAITTYHENLKITNNRFNGCSSSQGTIVLLATTTAAATVHIYDLDIHGNTFTNCGGTAIKAYVPVTGRNKGVKIYRNRINNQLRVGDLGGGIAVGGFAQTDTVGFGQNVIEYNVADGLQGTTGFANIMYGSYVVRYNVARNISSVIYDGCGLLFDLGADDCEGYGNYFENLSGTAGDFTAGAGIGIIYSATNITCYGNVFKNCHVGILYGNQATGRVSSIYNNTFIDCVLAGVFANETSYPADSNYVKNNIFTAKTGSAVAIRYLTGTWNRENNNCFYGFSAGTQSLHASTKTVDPKVDSAYITNNSSLVGAGENLGGYDYNGFPFPAAPTIGAIQRRRRSRIIPAKTLRTSPRTTARGRVR